MGRDSVSLGWVSYCTFNLFCIPLILSLFVYLSSYLNFLSHSEKSLKSPKIPMMKYRLMPQPNSIIVQIFKAKYFQNSDFLKAKKVTMQVIFGGVCVKEGLCYMRVSGRVLGVGITFPYLEENQASDISVISPNNEISFKLKLRVADLMLPSESILIYSNQKATFY